MSCTAYDNNFGSNVAPGWELSARGLAALAAYVDRADGEETSFDDLFDGPTYQAAQTIFAAQSHPMMPHGQTHYRPAVRYVTQGLPGHTSSAHWDHLPDPTTDRRSLSPRRPMVHAGNRPAWAVAQDSAHPEAGGSSNRHNIPDYSLRPRPGQGPSPRTYNFAG